MVKIPAFVLAPTVEQHFDQHDYKHKFYTMAFFISLIKMKFKFIFLTLVFLSGCCTKKYCQDNYRPFIKIILKNFTLDDLSKTRLFVFDKTTKTLLNSFTANLVTYESNDGTFRISSDDPNKEIRDQFFVIQTPTTSDTIFGTSYELYTYRIKCNSCFPFGSEKKTVTAFRNFSFQYKGQEFFTDSLTITK